MKKKQTPDTHTHTQRVYVQTDLTMSNNTAVIPPVGHVTHRETTEGRRRCDATLLPVAVMTIGVVTPQSWKKPWIDGRNPTNRWTTATDDLLMKIIAALQTDRTQHNPMAVGMKATTRKQHVVCCRTAQRFSVPDLEKHQQVKGNHNTQISQVREPIKWHCMSCLLNYQCEKCFHDTSFLYIYTCGKTSSRECQNQYFTNIWEFIFLTCLGSVQFSD